MTEIMKKTYFTPTVKTIIIEATELLASSDMEVGDDWNSGEGASNRRDEGRSIWGNTEW